MIPYHPPPPNQYRSKKYGKAQMRVINPERSYEKVYGQREAEHFSIEGDDESLHKAGAGPFAPSTRGEVPVENPRYDDDHDRR